MKKLLLILTLATSSIAWAQQKFDKPTTLFLMHSSGNHIEMDAEGGGRIQAPTKSNPQKMVFIPDGKGYYSIQVEGQARFLAQTGSWNTAFIEDSTSDNTKYTIETASKYFVKLRCKSNSRYLGTDSNAADSKVYSDKSGSDILHHWYFSEKVNQTPPADTIRYMVNPLVVRQHFEGWGVSLCWWAGQCGKWDDNKIDEIVSWMVSPNGLNYNIFRYNIGGGDDPQNRHCDPHHMGRGKGLRAEMEGFKDFSGDSYHWERDAAQRKIMLKIKEKRPDAIFEAFSNSCPYYMTYSGCCSGNSDGGKDNLKPEYYEEFANYLVDVCKHYKDEYGIEFKTLEPFNESVTGFWYANGVQEGCHFDYDSQIKFIRVLSPILKQSGLSTIISAADETNVGLQVDGMKRYIDAGVDKLVGQWNTHTYSGNNTDRARFCQLAHQTGKPYWMSEVGSGGNGLGGNLSLSQKLFDDMRYIQPEAWIDWQYMEEANDQWCTIRGSFNDQSYYKVKNFYVRQQCSRFIKQGYDIVASLNNQSLAAVNAARDTLVLVLLNEGSATTHHIDLSLFSQLPARSRIRSYRTSQNESLTLNTNYKLNGSTLSVTLPAQSITTLVIPAKANKTEENELLQAGKEYLIVPRLETTRALTATANNTNPTIQDIDYSEGQRWTLIDKGNGSFGLRNALGLNLTGNRARNSSTLTAVTGQASEQNFYIETVDYPYYKILSGYSRTHSFDLEREGSGAGTIVDLWDYTASTTTPTHRQWMLFPLSAPENPEADAIHSSPFTDASSSSTLHHQDGIYDMTGRRIDDSDFKNQNAKLPKGIYIINGKKVVISQ